MNGLGRVLILIYLLHQVQQGEQAILPNMGLIIVLSDASRDGGRIISKYHISLVSAWTWTEGDGERLSLFTN